MTVATKTIKPTSKEVTNKYILIAAECCGKVVNQKNKLIIKFKSQEDSDFFDRIAKNVGIPVEKSWRKRFSWDNKRHEKIYFQRIQLP